MKKKLTSSLLALSLAFNTIAVPGIIQVFAQDEVIINDEVVDNLTESETFVDEEIEAEYEVYLDEPPLTEAEINAQIEAEYQAYLQKLENQPSTVSTELTDGDYNYIILGGTVEITKYNGSGGDIIIPSTLGGISVTSIGEYAFSVGNSLTSVKIPDSVTSIGICAFYGCMSLKSVDIPYGVTSIETAAFRNTTIESITIPNSVTSIGDYAFYTCPRLTSVTIPGSITSIGHTTFGHCSNLTSVTLSDNFTSIGNGMFSSCTSLTSINIPDSVTSIGASAFYGCTSLTSVSIPDSVTSIGSSVFNSFTGLTSVSIPNSVTSIGSSAFYGCTSLTSVNIPDSVTSIELKTFYGCTSLTSVNIPKSVTSIGSSAFSDCSALTDVYYGGTEADFEKFYFSGGTIDSTFPTTNANFKIHYTIAVVTPDDDGNGDGNDDGNGDGNDDGNGDGNDSNGSNDDDDETEYTFYLSDEDISPQVGRAYQLTIINDNGDDLSDFNWISNNKDIVTVDDNGYVTAKKVGTTTVAYTNNVHSKTITIAVKPCELEPLDYWGYSWLAYEDMYVFQGRTISDYVNLCIDSYDKFLYTVSQQDYFNDNFGSDIIIDVCDYRDDLDDPEDSYMGFYGAAFLRPDGQIVIAYRGTEDKGDLYTDILFTTDLLLSKQFDKSIEFYKEIRKLYPDNDIVFTGHSLGGALATQMSIITGHEAVTMNGAGGVVLEDTYVQYIKNIESFDGVSNWNFVNYYNILDPIGNSNWDRYRTVGLYSIIPFAHARAAMIKLNNDRKTFSLYNQGSENKLHEILSVWSYEYLKCTNVNLYNKSGLTLNTLFTDVIYWLNEKICSRYIIYSLGDSTFTTSILSDSFVLKNGDTAMGKSGDDNYYIKEQDRFIIDIIDCQGFNNIYVEDPSYSKYVVRKFESIIDTEYDVIVDLYDNSNNILGYLRLSSNMNDSADMKLNETSIKQEMKNVASGSSGSSPFSVVSINDASDIYSNTIIHGSNIEVSILDENKDVLGTFNNKTESISTSEYAFVYAYDDYIDIELINDGKYIVVNSGTVTNGGIYTPDLTTNTIVTTFDNLSANTYINSHLDETDGTNIYTLNSDGETKTEVTTTEYVKVSSIIPSSTNATVKTGESEEITLTFNANAYSTNVELSMLGSNASATFNDDGNIVIYGANPGTDTLTITAADDSNVSTTVNITVSQEDAPTISATTSSGTYTSGDWSDASVTLTATKPSGYDTVYIYYEDYIEEDSITISNNGEYEITAYAYNSTTGERTAKSTFTVKIDTQAPEITGVENGGVYYIGKYVEVYDVNYSSAELDGTEFTFDEYVSGKYVSSEGSHTVTATDLAGKTTSVSFEIKAFPTTAEIEADSDNLAYWDELVSSIRIDFASSFNKYTSEQQLAIHNAIRELENFIREEQGLPPYVDGLLDDMLNGNYVDPDPTPDGGDTNPDGGSDPTPDYSYDDYYSNSGTTNNSYTSDALFGTSNSITNVSTPSTVTLTKADSTKTSAQVLANVEIPYPYSSRAVLGSFSLTGSSSDAYANGINVTMDSDCGYSEFAVVHYDNEGNYKVTYSVFSGPSFTFNPNSFSSFYIVGLVNSSSSTGSSSSSGSISTNYYETGSISIPTIGYIPEFRNILLGELINLDKITINDMEILGWYYDAEFTREVTNTSMFVVTQEVIDNGLYPKFNTVVAETLVDGSVNAGYVDTQADTNTSFVPTAVPSTIQKLLSKLF